MLLVALTGGVGAGKSTVAAMLADRGAVVIEADDLAREAVGPGSPGLVKVLDEFGPDVAAPDGSLDRAKLAARVFDDPDARRRLEGIVHPEVARLFAAEVGRRRDTDEIVVYAIPLLVERGLAGTFDVVVAVAAGEDVRAARVAAQGRMTAADARRRMQAQASDAERAAVADIVVDNEGSVADLADRVDLLWEELLGRGGHA
ncbi:MAG TPA: dephospho-CoA kinase [Actinomycetota bacterium]|nr:dephospho-CoA kinase [Actinomycetota bacterium]